MRLGVDPRKADQMVRGTVNLPHGTGKTAKVLVFANGDKAEAAREAGADVVGGDELIEKVAGGWLDFDAVVATPDMMGKVGRLGRVLGPRGLMPNPKTGTVTPDVAKAVSDIKGGKIEFRVDRHANLHFIIGKASFSEVQLAENYASALDEVLRLKPASSKGRYIKKVTVSTTMGPGVQVDPNRTKNVAAEDDARPDLIHAPSTARHPQGWRAFVVPEDWRPTPVRLATVLPVRRPRFARSRSRTRTVLHETKDRRLSRCACSGDRRVREADDLRRGQSRTRSDPRLPRPEPCARGVRLSGAGTRWSTTGRRPMARADKQAAVAEIVDSFNDSAGAVLTEYRGLTVKQLQDLRRSLGENANYAVVKNTLAKIAASEAGIEGVDDLLTGPTAIAFINGDVVEAAKGLRDFAKANPTLVIKGGVLDGKPLDAAEIAKLADLESREVLMGKLAGAMLASLSQAVYLLNAPLAQAARLAGALQAKAEQDPSILAGGASGINLAGRRRGGPGRGGARGGRRDRGPR